MLLRDFHYKLIAAINLSYGSAKISRPLELLGPFFNKSISSFTSDTKQWCAIILTNFSLLEKEGFICNHPNHSNLERPLTIS